MSIIGLHVPRALASVHSAGTQLGRWVGVAINIMLSAWLAPPRPAKRSLPDRHFTHEFVPRPPSGADGAARLSEVTTSCTTCHARCWEMPCGCIG